MKNQSYIYCGSNVTKTGRKVSGISTITFKHFLKQSVVLVDGIPLVPSIIKVSSSLVEFTMCCSYWLHNLTIYVLNSQQSFSL